MIPSPSAHAVTWPANVTPLAASRLSAFSFHSRGHLPFQLFSSIRDTTGGVTPPSSRAVCGTRFMHHVWRRMSHRFLQSSWEMSARIRRIGPLLRSLAHRLQKSVGHQTEYPYVDNENDTARLPASSLPQLKEVNTSTEISHFCANFTACIWIHASWRGVFRESAI